MFWLNWDFTLIAVAVTPFLLLFVSRFKKAVKAGNAGGPQGAKRDRRRSPAGSRVDAGRQSLRPGEAPKRSCSSVVSQATVGAALKARSVKALLSPVVTVAVAICTAIVLWRGAALILAGTMTVGELTVYLAYLTRFFKPVKDLATTTNAIAQAAVGVERVRASSTPTPSFPRSPTVSSPKPSTAPSSFDHVAFGYDPANPILTDVSPHHRARRVRRHRRPHRRRQIHRRQPDPALLRRSIRYASASMATTSATTSSSTSATRSATSCRTPSSSAAPSSRTSPSAAPAPPRKRSSPPRSSPTPTSSSRKMPLGYDTPVGERGSRSPAASASASASPASWFATAPSCCSTSPPPPSTANPRNSSSTPSKSS